MLLVPGSAAWADGGAVRAIERDRGFQISLFTSPNPLVAGPADLSVLVQDAESLAPVPAAQVAIRLTPRGRAYAAEEFEATRELATNKLFRDCHVELEPGWYDVEVIARTGEGPGHVRASIEVGPRPTQAAAFWPWYAWPAVPIVLFGVHEYLMHRRRV